MGDKDIIFGYCHDCNKLPEIKKLLQKEQKLKEIDGRVKKSIFKLNKLIDHINSWGIYVRRVRESQVREIIKILETKK